MKQNPDRPNSKHRPWGRKRGFILIVTVTLLGFLVLLLVFLSLIVRVETAVAANSVRSTQARQNALFALRAAIGQLQQEAGSDQRVTATADLLDPTAENPRWTGVWDTTDPTTGPVWLVSQADPTAAPGPDDTLTNPVRLVGTRTAFTADANQVDAELASIEVDTYPGLDGSQVIGRYAYWVGDEGVKASLVMPDRLAEVTYGSYAVAENRIRLRQQVPYAHHYFEDLNPPGFAGTDNDFGFDPAAGVNATNLPRIITRQQMRILTSTRTTDSFTLFLKSFYHDFTPMSLGVLASTHPTVAFSGLKQDLSAQPNLLGSGFADWSDYDSYMEAPSGGSTATPPITSEADLRRRYAIVAPPATPPSGEPVMSVSPVIASFVIQFGVRRDGSDQIVIGCRAHVSLWNPYTSALVPETLQLEITALPQVTVTDALLNAVDIPLQSLVGDPFVLSLPFTGGPFGSRPLLPGRVHNWRTDDGSDPSLTLRFNYTEINTAEGWAYDTAAFLPETGDLQIDGGTAQVVVTLKRGTDVLQSVVCPSMPSAGSWSVATDGDADETWDFGYGFRLKQPSDPDTDIPDGLNWLATTGADPRDNVIDPSLLVPHNAAAGWAPTGYADNSPIEIDWDGNGIPGHLLNRRIVTAPSPYTFNNDTPVFELPRGPLLSLGNLQHMRVEGVEPFAIGNSWGNGVTAPSGGRIGSWWDRFFFSGETIDDDRPDADRIEPLPNYHLRSIDTRIDRSTPLDLGDLRGSGVNSARYLLNGGAFNINSTSEAAWAAVLKSIRPSVTDTWERVNLDSSTGAQVTSGSTTIAEAITDSTQAGSTASFPEESDRASAFFRYPQSAQETFETASTGTLSGHNRSRFRQGWRGGDTGADLQEARDLTTEDLEDLAAAIVSRVRASGPFVSLDAFISDDGSGLGSPLEQAITAAAIPGGIDVTADPLDLSSYTLTQADILTAIGSMLAARSDTFVIRAYGEVVNPIRDRDADGVGDIEARAWCEAIVQRIPSFVDDSQSPETSAGNLNSTNAAFGRRFEVVHFRWLTAEDI